MTCQFHFHHIRTIQTGNLNWKLWIYFIDIFWGSREWLNWSFSKPIFPGDNKSPEFQLMRSLGLDCASTIYQLIPNEKSNTNFSWFKYLNHLSGEAGWNGCGIYSDGRFFALFAEFDIPQGRKYLMNIICWFAKFCLLTLIFIQSKYFPGTKILLNFILSQSKYLRQGMIVTFTLMAACQGGTSGHLLLSKYCKFFN